MTIQNEHRTCSHHRLVFDEQMNRISEDDHF